MKNKKLVAILALTLSLSGVLSACGFGGGDKPDEVVETTPTPEPTKAPKASVTPSPNAQSTVYTSKDKTLSIELPDATWSYKNDETNMVSFESPEQGKLLILHGNDMSTVVIPNTQDMAVTLEQASDMTQGTDFEIQDYKAENIDGVGVYSYVTKILNKEKGGGYSYVVNKYFANDEEFYSLTGSVKSDSADVLAKVQKSINSFKILGDSTLKAAAGKASGNTQTDGANGEGTTQGGTAGETGTEGTVQGGTPEGGTTTSQGSSEGTGDTSGNYSGGGLTAEQVLADTTQSRTIYRNSDGRPLVIYSDGTGNNWSDEDGNTYDFANDEDVYDQDGVDYYYHGEAGDVYFMPVE